MGRTNSLTEKVLTGIKDFRIGGNWIFHPRVQEHLSTYSIFFRYLGDRVARTGENGLCESHWDCDEAHDNCRLLVKVAHHCTYEPQTVFARELAPKQPDRKKVMVMVVQAEGDEGIGRLANVEAILKKDNPKAVMLSALIDPSMKWKELASRVTLVEKHV